MNIPTFVVSLARSSDRRQNMQTLLTQSGVSFEFFDAIDGTASEHFLHSEKAAPELTFKRKGYHLIPAEVACFASHYALWEKCIELDRPILVLEDNVSFSADPTGILDAIAPYIEQCGYIKFAAQHPRKFQPKFILTATHTIGIYHKGTCGTGAYVITPDAAKKLRDNAQQFIEPVDDYMEKVWRHGVRAYHVHPSVIVRSQVKSTIGSVRKQKKPVGLAHKLYIEGFRAYETIMRKLTNVI